MAIQDDLISIRGEAGIQRVLIATAQNVAESQLDAVKQWPEGAETSDIVRTLNAVIIGYSQAVKRLDALIEACEDGIAFTGTPVPPIPQPSADNLPPFTWSPNVASSEWVVTHNLGWEPLVQVLDVSGDEVEAQIIHITTNQFIVYFNSPRMGRVIAR